MRPSSSASLASASQPVRQDLRRLLKVLSKDKATSVRTVDGAIVVELPAGGVQRVIRFKEALVDQALHDGLLVWAGDQLLLSPEGANWLVRDADPQLGFLAQHRPLLIDLVAGRDEGERALQDLAESPLAWLRRRKGGNGEALVSTAAFAAGERLRADFTRAGIGPRITANWETSISSRRRADPGLSHGEIGLAARLRVARALDAVGPELSGVLLDVCCFLKGLELVEMERRWPVRSAKVVLCLGLERLATYYGLSSAARGPERGGAVRTWSTPDARGSVTNRAASPPA